MDKKKKGDIVRFVLLKNRNAFYCWSVNLEMITAVIEEMKE